MCFLAVLIYSKTTASLPRTDMTNSKVLRFVTSRSPRFHAVGIAAVHLAVWLLWVFPGMSRPNGLCGCFPWADRSSDQATVVLFPLARTSVHVHGLGSSRYNLTEASVCACLDKHYLGNPVLQ